jgi:hypothetical protein
VQANQTADIVSAMDADAPVQKRGPYKGKEMMAGVENKGLSSSAEEAANRAEVTAILIRRGYGVYRPEFDWNGEDLIVKTADNKHFRVVQLKSRPYVDEGRYSGKNIWMLFPSGRFSAVEERAWFLVPHDLLFKFTEERHGHGVGFIKHRNWSYPSIPRDMAKFLEKWTLHRTDDISKISN